VNSPATTTRIPLSPLSASQRLGLRARPTTAAFAEERRLSAADEAGAWEGKVLTRREVHRMLRASARESLRGKHVHAEALLLLRLMSSASLTDDSQSMFLLSQIWTQAAGNNDLRLQDVHEAARALARATTATTAGRAAAVLLDVCAALSISGDSSSKRVCARDALDVLDILRKGGGGDAGHALRGRAGEGGGGEGGGWDLLCVGEGAGGEGRGSGEEGGGVGEGGSTQQGLAALYDAALLSYSHQYCFSSQACVAFVYIYIYRYMYM
jgi:hypothetical protein